MTKDIIELLLPSTLESLDNTNKAQGNSRNHSFHLKSALAFLTMTSRRKMSICLLSLLLSAYAPLSTTFSLPRPMPTSRKQLRSKPSFREFVVFRGIPESEFPHEGADGNNNEDNDTNQRQARPLVRLIHDLFYAMTAPFPDLRKLSRKRDDDSKFVISLRLQDGFYALLAYFGVGVFAYHCVFEKWSIVDALYFTCVCFSTVG